MTGYVFSFLAGVAISVATYLRPERSADYILLIHFLYGMLAGWILRRFTSQKNSAFSLAAGYWSILIYMFVINFLTPSYASEPVTLASFSVLYTYLLGSLGIFAGWKLRSRFDVPN